MEYKCAGCDCQDHFAFRRSRLDEKWLCDTCWGYRYGEQSCERCQRNCYEEDFDPHLQIYICGHCFDKDIEKVVVNDLEDWKEKKHG